MRMRRITPKVERLIAEILFASRCHTHTAFLLRRDAVVSVGRSRAVGQCSRYNQLPSLHAEHECLRRYHRPHHETRKNLQRYTLVVLRWDKQGNLRNSKPCRHCYKTLRKFQVHRVVFSDEHGGLTSERIDGMDPSHVAESWGWKLRKREN